MLLKKPFKFFVNGISNESNADMRFDTPSAVMVNRSNSKIGL